MSFDDDAQEVPSQEQLLKELQTLQSRLDEIESLSNEEFIRSIAEKNFVGISIVSKNKKYLYANPAFATLTGYSYQEFMAISPFTLIYKDDIQAVKSRIENRMSEGNPPLQYETRILAKNGDIKWVEVSTSPIIFQKQEATLVIVFDITESKRAEESHKQSEEHYRALVNASSNLIWVMDADGKLAQCFGDEIYCVERKLRDIKGSGWLEAIHPDDRERVKQLWFEAVKTGETFETEYRISRTKGIYSYALAKGVPVRSDEGNIIEWVGTLTDITEQKLSEQKLRQKEEQLAEARKIEAIGHLAGGVAHNFNNMLTVIENYTQILLQQIEPEHDFYTPLKGIEKAADRCATLTNQLLAFGRKQFLVTKDIDLNKLISDLSPKIRRLCGGNVEILSNLNLLSANINADPEKLEQCLLTVIANSCDDMKNGGTLKIETSLMDVQNLKSDSQDFFSAGHCVLITISDNGVGMDKETLAGLFEPFFFFKSTQPNKGLEMASVYGIIKQSNGHITVKSEINKGTTYKFYFPIVEEEFKQVQSKTQLSSFESKIILLVDDEEQVREIVEVLLNTIGYETLSAESGESALRIAEEFPDKIDLLMTDMSMPGMNGLTLAEKMKSLRPDIRIIITSGDSEWIVGKKLSLGDVAFLQKPFSLQELRRKVREVID